MTPYNKADPLQRLFLSALSLGETSHRPDAQWLGVGNHDLSRKPCEMNGFPIWDGVTIGGSTSHAAGVFQFQPGTWADIAKRYSCHFGNLDDQYKAAWCLASEVFQHKTGQDLEAALRQKSFAVIQNMLYRTWPSVAGNKANPVGLAEYLSHLADW